MPDFEEGYSCNNGRQVTIEMDDLTHTVSVFDVDHREVGRMIFFECDGQVLRLTWAYLDKLGKEYVRQGIGRRCLQLVSERYRLPIMAEEDDGIRKRDGSHLTGDAPSFISKMRDEGLIIPSRELESDKAIEDC